MAATRSEIWRAASSLGGTPDHPRTTLGRRREEPAAPPPVEAAPEMTAQYGVLGRAGSATVGLDLMGCNTISLLGVQGFGKSYTLGVIGEMATTAVSGINVLLSPLATVTEAHLAALEPGEALVWAQRSTDKRFTQRPVKVTMRPRFTQHGGGTKTAVSGRTVR